MFHFYSDVFHQFRLFFKKKKSSEAVALDSRGRAWSLGKFEKAPVLFAGFSHSFKNEMRVQKNGFEILKSKFVNFIKWINFKWKFERTRIAIRG